MRDQLHSIRTRLADLRASLRRAETRLETERNPEEIKVLKARASALRRGIAVADGLMQEVCRLREKVKK